jgi:hypothetical protein
MVKLDICELGMSQFLSLSSRARFCYSADISCSEKLVYGPFNAPRRVKYNKDREKEKDIYSSQLQISYSLFQIALYILAQLKEIMRAKIEVEMKVSHVKQ